MKQSRYVLGFGLILIVAVLGALVVSVAAAIQRGDEPVDVVKKAVMVLERSDLSHLSEYFCRDQTEAFQASLQAGLDQLDAIGIDPDELFGVVEVNFRDMVYEETGRAGDKAAVRVRGTMSLDFDGDGLGTLVRKAAAGVGYEPKEQELDLIAMILDHLPRPEVSLDAEVQLIKQDDEWVLCGNADLFEASVVEFPGYSVDFDLDIPDLEFDLGTKFDGGAREAIRGSGQVVSEERVVGGFEVVSLTGAGDVIITQGDEQGLSIETDNNLMGYIEAKVENGTLILGFTDEARRKNIRPSQGITFHVRVQDLAGLDLLGAGDIHAASLGADRLEILLAGAGDVSIDELSAEELEVHLSGAGDIRLAGRVTEQDVELNGAGDYHAGKLESKTTRVTLSGVGNATVWSTGTLDARIRGVGNISYYGQPQVISSSAGVSGLVNLGDR